MRNYINFSNEQEKEPVTPELRCLVKMAIYSALEYEDFSKKAEISVTFTDNEGIHEINSAQRGVDAPTDVLSFPMMSGDDSDADTDYSNGAVMLGDIVLNLERARAQAAEYGHSYTREVAFLTVHSVLHLLGYDHLTSEEDDRDMRARQDAVLDIMGITR